MFNIQFGGCNSSQKAVAKFDVGKRYYDTLCVCEEDENGLKAFLLDVRNMPENDFNEIIDRLGVKLL